MARKAYPNWENPLSGVPYYTGPYLYNDGNAILAVMAAADPVHYQLHYDTYIELYTHYKNAQ